MKNVVGTAALFIALLLFAMASLVLLPAPTYNLWKLKILVTECGHFIAPVALFSLLFWRRSKLSRAAAIVAAVASCILLLPALQSIRVLRTLPEPRPSVRSFIGRLYGGSETTLEPRKLVVPASGGGGLVVEYHAARQVHDAREFRVQPGQRAAKPAPPLVVMIHGGSWQGGEPGQLGALSYRLAHAGYAVAAVSYRFAPRTAFPGQLADVRDEIGWLRDRAATLGFDPDRVVVLGRSAGGQLALMYAYADRPPFVRGVISFYAPTDLAWGYANPSKPRVHPSRRYLSEYVGTTPSADAAAYAAASPITYADSASPRTLLLHGASDELVFAEHSQRLADVLLKARNPATFVTLPWATHGCDYIVRGPCYQISAVVVERFLAGVL